MAELPSEVRLIIRGASLRMTPEDDITYSSSGPLGILGIVDDAYESSVCGPDSPTSDWLRVSASRHNRVEHHCLWLSFLSDSMHDRMKETTM